MLMPPFHHRFQRRESPGTAPWRCWTCLRSGDRRQPNDTRRWTAMIKKAAITVGATAALALAGAAFTAPAAYADSSAKTTGARATFTSEGEVFRLYDTS